MEGGKAKGKQNLLKIDPDLGDSIVCLNLHVVSACHLTRRTILHSSLRQHLLVSVILLGSENSRPGLAAKSSVSAQVFLNPELTVGHYEFSFY